MDAEAVAARIWPGRNPSLEPLGGGITNHNYRPLHRVRRPHHPATQAGQGFERGPRNLGRHYKWIDWVAILWIGIIAIMFCVPFASVGIPGNDGFTWDFVNYAPLLVGGAFVLFGGLYLVSARKWFKGPVRQGTQEELAAIERQYEPPGTSGVTSPASLRTDLVSGASVPLTPASPSAGLSLLKCCSYRF